MAEKRYFWFKLHVDFFKTKETKKLRKMAGGSVYTIIYLKLILLSLREEGRLYFEEVDDSFAEELALEIDESVEDVKMTLMFLERVSLLEVIETDVIQLPVAVHNIGKETASAGRKRKQREREKNESVTLSHASHKCVTTELEIEKDLKKDLPLKKENRKTHRASNDLEEDEKNAVEWIKKHLDLVKPEKRRILAKKHGLKSILILYDKFKIDQRDQNLHMGYFTARLEQYERQVKPIILPSQQVRAKKHKGVYHNAPLGSMAGNEELKRLSQEAIMRFS